MATAPITTDDQVEPKRGCHALMGHGRCIRKRTSGSCRGESGICVGYKVLTVNGKVIHGKRLEPIGESKDPIFPARTLSIVPSGKETFDLTRGAGIPTDELECNRRCGSADCINKISNGHCPSAEHDRIRCRSKQGMLQNVVELLRKHCPKTPCVIGQLAGTKPEYPNIPSNN